MRSAVRRLISSGIRRGQAPIGYNPGVKNAIARIFGVCLILVGCSQPNIARGGTPGGIWMRYTTSQPEAKTPKPYYTRTPTAFSPATIQPETGIVLDPTNIPPQPSDVPLPVVDSLCSPLEFVDLKDLPRMISDGYHPPPKGSDARHQGVDFAYYHWKGQGPIEGTSVKAVLPGVVAVSEKDSYPFGNVVVIENAARTIASSHPGGIRYR